MISLPTKEALRQQVIDRFWETVPPMWNQVRNNLRSIAAESFEISVEQFHILRHIRKGICSVSELADVKQISRPAISQAVEALVAKGLISRRQDADDRRYVRLILTPSGDDLLNRIFQQNRAWMMQKLSGLEEEEIKTITQAFDILNRTLNE
jgi:DNA-binding MarR family transcriptional regulator